MRKFKKVVVIGLDGLDPAIIERLLAAGELPHFAQLQSRGGYARVATTIPAQTPVAWSTFATGVNPGRHGIFDFVGRNLRTYQPELALNRYEQTSSFLPPKVVNLRRAEPLWQRLSAAGIPSTVIRCPCSYPPDTLRGRLLAGMGVPDLRGGFGTATFYSTAPTIEAAEGEIAIAVRPEPDGSIVTQIFGPRHPRTHEDLACPIVVLPEPHQSKVTIRTLDDPRGVEVQERTWSDWLRVKFKVGLITSVRGIVRFILLRLVPHLELYASPVNFDPSAPVFPISFPASYARELAANNRAYYTAGMVEDHAGLNSGRLDEAAFLQQCELVVAEREWMMRQELDRCEEGFFFVLFDTPDRVQHMFWRAHAARLAASGGRQELEWGQIVDEQYRRADRILGMALEYADDQTLVIALSDHGFGGFRRQFDVNRWLHQSGLLTLKPGASAEADNSRAFAGADWSRTRAYALGLSGLYLNLAGREAQGIVPAAEAAALRREIAEQLTGLHDPTTGDLAIQSALPRDQVYVGPYADEAPDVLINYAAGYRTSWATTRGQLSGDVWDDNTKRWSGDHVVDPALVPGVLFMNRSFHGAAPGLADLAPTILDALDAPPAPAMEGSSLLP